MYYHYYLSRSSTVFTSSPFTIFSMLFKSLGEAGLGEAVLGRTGGDTEPPRTFPPDGEELRLRVCPGVTVSKALPRPPLCGGNV